MARKWFTGHATDEERRMEKAITEYEVAARSARQEGHTSRAEQCERVAASLQERLTEAEAEPRGYFHRGN